MQRELLTASMMGCLVGCMRKFFYRYEICLKSTAERSALSFGTAWHSAMEARWRGYTADGALEKAVGEAQTLSELQVSTLAALLAGYYRKYECDPVVAMQPETEFRFPLDRSRTFDIAGKIDGIGTLDDGRACLLEHKTTSDSVAPESDYWLRLRCNNQIMQYVHAARACNKPVEVVLYDVCRKPSIKPKLIPVLDELGRKMVVDAAGNRILKKDGTPRESATEGCVVLNREETPEEFGERLTADIAERPDFYFARREVPVLDQDLDEFLIQRVELSRLILSLRRASRATALPHQAWPRNCSDMTCGFCDYKEFCLQNISVDPAKPPAGFAVGEKNPELAGINGGAK